LTIDKELEAKILRYHHVEKWRVGTIARQLGVHHNTVNRVLSQAGMPKAERADRPSLIDGYLPFINETLKQFPSLTASRLYAMVRERGYAGGPDHFRHQIACLRPRPEPEAFQRLKTLPGEQGQVDWGHFGQVTIGRATHKLMAFVLVLSYSRRIFLRFYLNAQMANFLRGHEAAFMAWEGLPKVLLYDNLKSAVLERRGQAIRFHPTLLDFAAHYRFEPRPVAVARGNEAAPAHPALAAFVHPCTSKDAWNVPSVMCGTTSGRHANGAISTTSMPRLRPGVMTGPWIAPARRIVHARFARPLRRSSRCCCLCRIIRIPPMSAWR